MSTRERTGAGTTAWHAEAVRTPHETVRALREAVEHALHFPADLRPRRPGPRATHVLRASSVFLFVLFAVGWSWVIVEEVGSPADAPG